ncbi:MAG TPA: carboxypeptidase-like regulatory domain-containing protein [Kofleriaceae bacterium]|nr:carboxypeptidase-like regulatory domain-containing protein [Kofleriaceae bacterium]
MPIWLVAAFVVSGDVQGTPLPVVATVTATARDSGERHETTTSPGGHFELALAAGTYDFVIRANGISVPKLSVAVAGDTTLDPITMPIVETTYTCVCPGQVEVKRLVPARPVGRDRTHVPFLAMHGTIDPATAVTTLDGAPRLAGAPGVPFAWLYQIETFQAAAPIDVASGVGGATALTLLRAGGQPEATGTVLVAATPGAELALTAPLTSATSVAAAIAAQGDDRDALLRVAHDLAADQQLSATVLAQAHGDTRDRWASAAYRRTLLDARLAITARATTERLVTPADEAARAASLDAHVLERTGAELAATWRDDGHELRAIASRGAGQRDGVGHADAALGFGEHWKPEAHWNLWAGVRAEQRAYAARDAWVIAPRALLAFDPAKRDHGFVIAYERVPHVDGAPGAWLAATTRSHDEVVAGYVYGDDRWSISAIVRDRIGIERGVEGHIDYRGDRTQLVAGASSIRRLASIAVDQAVLGNRPDAIAIAASAQRTDEATRAGAAIHWRRTAARVGRGSVRPPSAMDVDVSLEGYKAGDAMGAQLVASGIWF